MSDGEMLKLLLDGQRRFETRVDKSIERMADKQDEILKAVNEVNIAANSNTAAIHNHDQEDEHRFNVVHKRIDALNLGPNTKVVVAIIGLISSIVAAAVASVVK